MFDVSARPFMKDSVLSFAVPLKKFAQMVEDMDESKTIGLIPSIPCKIGRIKIYQNPALSLRVGRGFLF